MPLATEVAASAWRKEANSTKRSIISKNADEFRAALGLLGTVAPELSLEWQLKCFEDRLGPRLLGIDGMQQVRNDLSRARRTFAPPLREYLDRRIMAILNDFGARLFDLQEHPMDETEYRNTRWFRDARFNAASYSSTPTPGRDPELLQRLREDPDLLEYLGSIVINKAEKFNTSSSDILLYDTIPVKTETRILCCKLLARIQPDPDLCPIELASEVMEILLGEINAFDEVEFVAEDEWRDLLQSDFEIPIVRNPEDDYVLERCLEVIELLDGNARRGRERIIFGPKANSSRTEGGPSGG